MDIKFKPEDLVFIESRMVKLILEKEGVLPDREKVKRIVLEGSMVKYFVSNHDGYFKEDELIPATKVGLEKFFENIYKTFVENHRKVEKLALKRVDE